MTTALDLISRSMRLLGVYAIGEAPSADESVSGLAALNGLMGSLSNTPMVYAKTLDTIALTGGVASITVGPSGTTVTDRPVQVLDESYLVNGDVTYALSLFNGQQYSDISVKSTQGIPEAMWPLMNMPDVQLTFYPVPNAGLTLKLWSVKALQTFPALTTTVSLPTGYEGALPFWLAEVWAAELQVPVPASVDKLAKRYRNELGLTNLVIPMLKTNQPVVSGHYNVLTNGRV
jgi:hypothetical protein